jgi:hypothetical protein
LYKRIYKTEMKFWDVLGREKKPLNCHKYATFWGGFFNFFGQKQWFENFLTTLHCGLKRHKVGFLIDP